MIDGQLELSLANAGGCRPLSPRQRRLSRAQWWFARMRQTVESALDWQPAPPPCPEQTWLPNAGRQAVAASASNAANATQKPNHEEQQICA